ncbi:MAG TPA: radical SAM protein [Victivallales bacterium]|nr:radical SAM protein [Victivallales bacterium]HPO90508.1 radical SAM protein [Victivallales bacterium]HRR06360.1 radical SAM protein [Victivallales bacterium]
MHNENSNYYIDFLLKKRNYTLSDISDIEFILSNDTEKHWNLIKEKAKEIKNCQFGKTVRLYRPIYVSNYCVNDCEYCGCATSVNRERKVLSEDEIINECEKTKREGFDSILLVSGEDSSKTNTDYLVRAVKIMKKYFSFVAIEAGSFSLDDCKRLLFSGVDSFVLYQETFDRKIYESIHKGPKKDYDKRIKAIFDAADAGFQSLGFGILLGIADWKSDIVALANFAYEFRKKYWDRTISFSFPRLRPPAEEKFPKFKVTEHTLEKIFILFRLLFPDAELNVSTRERPEFRNNIVKYAATTMSAASGTYPGAYSGIKKELEQFEIQDTRTVKEICEDIERLGLQPIFKYWDRAFSLSL